MLKVQLDTIAWEVCTATILKLNPIDPKPTLGYSDLWGEVLTLGSPRRTRM